MKEEEIVLIAVGIFSGIFLYFISLFIQLVLLSNIFKALSILLPLLIIFLIFYRKSLLLKEYETYFTAFLRDLSENLRAGMNLTNALESLKDVDYKGLTPLVKKLITEIKIGIPFDAALNNLARRTNSKIISKICLTVGQSIRAGGDVAGILDAVSKSMLEIEKIRRERKLYLTSTITNSYIIFFVFIGIVIVMSKFLIPEIVKGAQMKVDIKFLNQIFTHMILIQGFFSGLTIGKMAEGSLIAGLRHSVIMIAIGLLATMFILTSNS